jgi:hypothetical protein
MYSRTPLRTAAGPVRVGTHAPTETSKATLWGRLSQHRRQLARGNTRRPNSADMSALPSPAATPAGPVDRLLV